VTIREQGPEQRLAVIYAELGRLGLPALVMGGHAVRFYGIDRSTIDYDLAITLPEPRWERLPEVLRASPLFAIVREGPSWRPSDFRRLIVGALPDGREERLEFWRRNHLLAPFADLDRRKTIGRYGGGEVAFLGLDDLIRSKETEREDDWRDVRLLEEIADERRLAGDPVPLVACLAELRSQRGFETALRRGLLGPNDATREAAVVARHPVSRAFLAPYAPITMALESEAIEKLLSGPIASLAPGSARHLALVEAVRRLHQRDRMAEDRADKERAARSQPG
jgi:hypothetical protein